MGARGAFTGFLFKSLPRRSDGRDTFGVCKVDLLVAPVKSAGSEPAALQRDPTPAAG
jgi:hypothetical protein